VIINKCQFDFITHEQYTSRIRFHAVSRIIENCQKKKALFNLADIIA